jgi:hypothetical protein
MFGPLGPQRILVAIGPWHGNQVVVYHSRNIATKDVLPAEPAVRFTPLMRTQHPQR